MSTTKLTGNTTEGHANVSGPTAESAPRYTQAYEVMADGRVFSVLHNWRGYGKREMVQHPNADGYPSVRLTINGKRTHVAVHYLVARTFLPPQPAANYEVRHIDGDKQNSSAPNLAWGTRKDNADDREKHGRTSRGEKHAAHVREGHRAHGYYQKVQS